MSDKGQGQSATSDEVVATAADEQEASLEKSQLLQPHDDAADGEEDVARIMSNQYQGLMSVINGRRMNGWKHKLIPM